MAGEEREPKQKAALYQGSAAGWDLNERGHGDSGPPQGHLLKAASRAQEQPVDGGLPLQVPRCPE